MEIKVMVVDDEERQRRSIVRHVDWERYRMQVVGGSRGRRGGIGAGRARRAGSADHRHTPAWRERA
ncbi:response regulator [Cohnella rhizosphaerae]|uniref:Uncharacterized protein n=1 Tax=Cohnella rhizosphaerae TaxID=1457232 RepID=A0A9X4KUF1_9BACL|nr:hypothetical protein [Cohnella rhizosphaerae]MDG0811215.1 hypothetical protein [Cohnella rhizosphaerae]